MVCCRTVVSSGDIQEAIALLGHCLPAGKGKTYVPKLNASGFIRR